MLTLRAAFRKRLRKAAPRPGYGPSRHPQSGKGMGVSGAGGVAKPGWATTKQPIPGGGSKKPATPQAKPLPGVTPLGLPAGKHKNVKAAVMKAVRMVAKHKDKQGSTAHHGRGGFKTPPPQEERRTAEELAMEADADSASMEELEAAAEMLDAAEEQRRKEGFQQDAERRYDAPSGPYNEEDV